ncbi:hypothetical protein GCM10027051_28280 [Niabella terrae]
MIDEIQEVSEAINILCYFYKQVPELHVIAAGSLLETALNGDVKISVGRVEYKVVRPLSIDEILQVNADKAALGQFRKTPMNEFAHEKLLQLFHTYKLIGGMPAIVDHYLQRRNLNVLWGIYKSLIVSCINEVEKYGPISRLAA